MNEKKYLDYDIKDFLTDEAFRKWVIEADKESSIFWQKWLEQHPEKRKEVLYAREIINSLKFKEADGLEQDQEEVLGHILKGKKSVSGRGIKPLKPSENGRSLFFWSKVAAVFLIAVASCFYVFYTDKSPHTELIVKENASGNKSIFTLPDGTNVTLNANSILKYPAKFEKGVRLVELIGEGYFAVAHDTANPFIVNAFNIETTALGTAFNIKAFPEDDDIKVTLVTGKVKVRQTDAGEDDKAVFYLLPGEKFTHTVANNLNSKGRFDMVEETGWKEGVLVFANTAIEEMERILERWYGVDIIIEGKPSASWNLEGKFVNQGLMQFLEGLKFTHNIQYEFVTDKKIIITLNPE